MLGLYAAAHVLLALLMTGFALARVARGYVSARRRAELPVVALWTDYAAAVALIALAAIHAPGFGT